MIQYILAFLCKMLGALLELVWVLAQVCYKLEGTYLIFYTFCLSFPYFRKSLVFT